MSVTLYSSANYHKQREFIALTGNQEIEILENDIDFALNLMADVMTY